MLLATQRRLHHNHYIIKIQPQCIMNNNLTNLTIEPLQGSAILAHLPSLARLRIRVFREFPYLYEGSLDYESHYLSTYAQTPDCLLLVARHGDAIVGCSTGLPLRHEPESLIAPFLDANLDPDTIFYCGESVVLPDHRGQGLGGRFFEAREAYARALGLTMSCFCRVVRAPDHALRPSDYTPLDGFWRRRGYTPHPTLEATMRWRQLGHSQETAHRMAFWLKPLA